MIIDDDDIEETSELFSCYPVVTMERCTDRPEELIEQAARICYMSTGTGDDSRARLLTHLKKQGHTAPFEHASASFLIKNVSRNLTHELVRHRLASYCELSQRYVNVLGNKIIIPESIRKNLEAYDVFLDCVATSRKSYGKLVSLGIPKEDARYCLISGMTTEIMMTANLREFMHVVELRSSKAAHWEIRDMAVKINDLLHSVAPIIF